MHTELDVLGIVSERLTTLGVPFMLTGSFALAYYATPRMTRDLDLVVQLTEGDIDHVGAAFAGDFYIDPDSMRSAVRNERMFNLMHLASGIKVDMIVRKASEYRRTEFGRRRPVTVAGIDTWIATQEDLILSKLVWARETASELQLRGSAADAGISRYGLLESLGCGTRGRLDARRGHSMSDTSQDVAERVRGRHARMAPEERLQIAAAMYETARIIIDSSLPANLSREQRRLEIARRLYGGEMPAAALEAHARQPEDDWTR